MSSSVGFRLFGCSESRRRFSRSIHRSPTSQHGLENRGSSQPRSARRPGYTHPRPCYAAQISTLLQFRQNAPLVARASPRLLLRKRPGNHAQLATLYPAHHGTTCFGYASCNGNVRTLRIVFRLSPGARDTSPPRRDKKHQALARHVATGSRCAWQWHLPLEAPSAHHCA